ncbi:MAG: MFS transporter [Gemmatimonadetes bacterium]|nr:MFS transporter [Gemmatimonadota bacterium]
MSDATSSTTQAGRVLRAIQRVFKRASQIEPDEFPAAVTAFCLFFFVLGGYFAVRPVRETVGTILGRDRVADLYMVTWVTSIAIVPAYGALCARFRRSVFLPWIYGFVAIALATVGAVMMANQDSIAIGQFFYVMISVLNLFVVSVFWSFLLELFNPAQTKRLFPAIAAGGTAGALIGPALTAWLVGMIGNPGILFFGGGMFVMAIVCQRLLLRMWKQGRSGVASTGQLADRPMGGNVLAGFTLILKSPYLLGIALFVVLLASANTLLYFEQLNLVTITFEDTETRTRVFSLLDTTVQSLTIISQLIITGRVAKKWGVVPLVTIVPLVMIAGFLALASFYTFAVLAVVMVARRAGEYAFVRPGREMLFGGLDAETKYKAKSTIDVPVYRGGDAISAQVDTALQGGGMTPQTVALLGAGLCAAWAFNGLLIGRHREVLEQRLEAAPAH